MLNVAGRMALTNATLSAVPVHTSIAIGLSQWALKHIDKLRRAFIWGGEQSIGGGKMQGRLDHCLSPSGPGGSRRCRPKESWHCTQNKMGVEAEGRSGSPSLFIAGEEG